MSGLTSRQAPRKGENYELSVDLNSEYRDKRKDAIKRVIASMTVGKGVLSLAKFRLFRRRKLIHGRC